MSPALSYLLLGATALWVGLWVADRIEMAWKARKQGNAPAGQADPALPSKVQIEEWLAFVKAHKMGWVDTGEVSVGLSYGRTLRYAPEWVEMRPFLSEEAVRLTEYVGPSALVEGSRRPVHIKRLISRDLRVLLRKMDG
ncbi:MAG: hypothetical protein OYK82_00390 [Gammaproteobacteria bacterium]|nr:hypothetical protein [Gammaproteobacteria bacterium]